MQGLVKRFRRNHRPFFRWPDGRTRKCTKARFAGHENGRVICVTTEDRGHGRLSCPPEAAFVPFRVSPAGEAKTSEPFSVRRRRLQCIQWQRPSAHAGRRGNGHRTHRSKGTRCRVLAAGFWYGGLGACWCGGFIETALPNSASLYLLLCYFTLFSRILALNM